MLLRWRWAPVFGASDEGLEVMRQLRFLLMLSISKPVPKFDMCHLFFSMGKLPVLLIGLFFVLPYLID